MRALKSLPSSFFLSEPVIILNIFSDKASFVERASIKILSHDVFQIYCAFKIILILSNFSVDIKKYGTTFDQFISYLLNLFYLSS